MRTRTSKATSSPDIARVSPESAYRPPYVWAGVAALGVFALYALTLAPTTQFWDTSEYIATAHILGIPHPPGNPLFVVLARAWELLLAPTGLSVAVRINLFSAAMSAAAHGFWFLLAHRILAFVAGGERFRLVGAAVAVLVSATAFTVWNQSNVNEKVYTVSLFTIALLSWLAFHWRARRDDRLLVLAAYLLVLSTGNHLMAALAAPALLVFALLVRPRALAAPRVLGGVALAAALGLSVQLFLPIRAAQRPVIAEGDPRCESLAAATASIYTNGAAGCEALSAELTREQYDKPSILLDPTVYPRQRLPRSIGLVAAQVVNYLQYFDWQWARSVAGSDTVFGGARPLLTLLFTVLGLFGAWTHYRKDRASWAYVAVLFATLSLGLVFYLNFEYGYSFARLGPTEVRERDYFFIVGFSVWGLWAGIGLAALWRRLADGAAGRIAATAAARRRRVPAGPDSPGGPGTAHAGPPPAPRRLCHALTAPVLALAVLPLVLNWSWASRSGDYAARDWAYDLLQSVEPYGVLFTNGDNDSFPLWYLQEVEGIRKDVTVVITTYLNLSWYAKQIRDLTRACPEGVRAGDDATRILCQRPYHEASGPALYARGGERPEPGDTILPLTDEQIDAITEGAYVLPRDAELRAGRIRTTLPAGHVITPSDTFVTAILAASLGRRPIHFSSIQETTERLRIRPYLVRTGLSLKVNDGPVRPDPTAGRVRLSPSALADASGDFIDLTTTDALLRDVFVHRGLPESRAFWPDRPSANILAQYAFAHYSSAQAHALLGHQDRANEHAAKGDAWMRMAGFIAAPEE